MKPVSFNNRADNVKFNKNKPVKKQESGIDNAISEIKDTIAESVSDWRQTGKTMGIFASAYAASPFIKEQISLENLKNVMAGTSGSAMVTAFLNTGKILGGAIGSVLGTGAGIIEAGAEQLHLKEKQSEENRIELPQKETIDLKKPIVQEFIDGIERIAMNYAPEGIKELYLIRGRNDEIEPYQSVNFGERELPEINQDRLMKTFMDIAGTPGVSGDEATISKKIQGYLKNMNIKYVEDEAKNLIATIPATKGKEDSPSVLFCSHMDTVRPTDKEAMKFDGVRFSTDEKHILGADDRTGVAEILEGIKTIQESGIEHPEIKLVFTRNEETGSLSSSKINEETVANRPTFGFAVDFLDKDALFLTSNTDMPDMKESNFKTEDLIVQLALRSLADSGIKPRLFKGSIMEGAWSDANSKPLNNDKIQTLPIGTGSNSEHSFMENVKLKALGQIARTIVGLAANGCDFKVDENQNIMPRLPSKEDRI